METLVPSSIFLKNLESFAGGTRSGRTEVMVLGASIWSAAGNEKSMLDSYEWLIINFGTTGFRWNLPTHQVFSPAILRGSGKGGGAVGDFLSPESLAHQVLIFR